MAGPAKLAAAAPVSTKMPAPMIAPIPSATRLTGPRARFSPPSSDEASLRSMSKDLRPSRFDGIQSPSSAAQSNVYWNPEKYNDQAGKAETGLIPEQGRFDRQGQNNIQRREHRISQRAVRTLHFRALHTQDKHSRDR